MTDERVVDARGLRCPAPVIALARLAKASPPGALVTVWWTDPAARHDIPAWARMRGHAVLGTRPLDEGAAQPRPPGDDRPGTPDAPKAHVTEIRLGTQASGA